MHTLLLCSVYMVILYTCVVVWCVWKENNNKKYIHDHDITYAVTV